LGEEPSRTSAERLDAVDGAKESDSVLAGRYNLCFFLILKEILKLILYLYAAARACEVQARIVSESKYLTPNHSDPSGQAIAHTKYEFCAVKSNHSC
jgi:hypothetical protein